MNGFHSKPSKEIKALFDEQLMEVTKNDEIIPFNTDIILTDLVQAGITVLDAFDILYKIRPHLYPAIKTEKIIQLLNQVIQEQGYSEGEYLPGSYLQPILIELPNGEKELFNFKRIKLIIKEGLSEFTYSSKTFRAAVDELHRIVKTLRSSEIKLETIQKMIPAVMRNVIGVNPFSATRCEEDYQIVINIAKNFHAYWAAIPEPEKLSVLKNLFEPIFRVILLSFDYLPGNTFLNTIHQIQELVADLAKHRDQILSAKEIYYLGKTAKIVMNFYQFPDKNIKIDDIELIKATEIIMNVVHGLMNRGSISWIVVINSAGNELYSKFGNVETKEAKRSLIGMAISGVQSIVNELTDYGIKEIQQEEGYTIIIEKREAFSLISLVKQSSHLVRQKLFDLTNFIQINLKDDIVNFNGSIDIFYKKINPYINDRLLNFLS